MRIGIVCDLQLPRPWSAASERALLARELDRIALADTLGFGSAWVQEHHFLEELGHGGGAVPFLAAAAGRTTALRLGLGVLSVDPAVRHPAVLAADVATLDLLAEGRLDVATGVARTGIEVAGLGLARQTARSRWEQYTGVLARMLAEAPFGGAGEGTSAALPPRVVLPRPWQQPHPPLWARCDRPADIGTAARLGLGALCRSVLEPEEAAEWIAEYRGVLRSTRCVPVGAAVEPRVAVCVPMFVHADEATAIDTGIDGLHFQAFATSHYERFGEHVPGGTDLWAAFLARRADVGLARDAVVADGQPLSVRVLRDGQAAVRGAVGTPAQVAELVGRYAAAGVDDLLLVLPAGAAVSAGAGAGAGSGRDEATGEDAVADALRLFAAEVLPGVPADVPPDDELRTAVREALARRPVPPPFLPEAVGALAEAPPPAPAPAPAAGPSSSSGPAVGVAFAAGEGAGGADRPSPAGPAARLRVSRERLRGSLGAGGTIAVRRAVARADDRWLERTLGSDRGLRVIFTAMRSRYVPEAAQGFLGAIAYELRDADGRVRTWGVRITPTGATVAPGPVEEPALTVQLGLADFVRLAAGELDPGHLLLGGRMDLRGDFSLATRLGPMFGQ
ncbi:LLM class flavin-dependent oxidoreductase [Paraconexibacter antarcticus]|uniref:LLM class flavin-dependent oxidoreductase n=1 Tax=Paraconexibacter antarcticus TaxID=2949664 RepID=A0ABY5E280_9ACTN|nr:LLM class flavin-dependent oxidoreductase [Paraconexibacter antarcticus]UTI66915.1 LLM class flavin-dependent oxidoreductase [Paraconexibacter antarcticus]